MFLNREQAGNMLIAKIADKKYADISLLALPRGGVIVGKPIADYLNLSMKLLIVRKIGHPYNPEVAIGAMMPDASTILDKETVLRWRISESVLQELMKQEYYELKNRTEKYQNVVLPEDIKGKTVMLIDDGVATGYTLLAAIKWLKKFEPLSVTVCVPVIAYDALADIQNVTDEVIFLHAPRDFIAVGNYYQDFEPVNDKEIINILKIGDKKV